MPNNKIKLSDEDGSPNKIPKIKQSSLTEKHEAMGFQQGSIEDIIKDTQDGIAAIYSM